MPFVSTIRFEAGYIIVTDDGGRSTKYPVSDFLRAVDIPSLDVAKITSGTFAAARIGTGAVTATQLDTDAVTSIKIQDAAVTIGKIDSTLLGYLLPVGRIDYTGIDYCKIG